MELTPYGYTKQQIEERKQLFKTLKANLKKIKLPKTPVQLNAGETIMNCTTFVEVHLSFIERNIEKDICVPYLTRLIKFAEII